MKKAPKHKQLLYISCAVLLFALFTGIGISWRGLQTGVQQSGASAQEPSDINNDNKVDVFDLSTLLARWQTADVSSDINKDGIVNVFDLSMLLSRWGVVVASGGLSLPKIAWEGGSSYWKQFAKTDTAGWDDPNFFPISVYLSSANPAHVASLKDAGINLYMGVEHSPAIFPLTNITNQGLYAMPQQEEWTPSEVGNDAGVVAWFISDECEMGMPLACSSGETQALTQQQSWVAMVRSYNDGRFAHANFGNGILRTFWAPTTMSQHVQLVDSSSADKYTYTSPDVVSIIDGVHDAPDWPNGVPVSRAYSYGWQADQIRRFQNQGSLKPVWTFIETARPYVGEAGALTISSEQMEGAVWSALIHEARGIAYFQHNNSPTGCTQNYSIVDCPAVHSAVKSVNTKVRLLAPVLNTQSYYNSSRTVNGMTYQYYSFNNGTDTMLKTYGSDAYIFAALGMRCNNTGCTSGVVDGIGSKTFILPAGITGTTVTVVDENRTIPVVGGSFTDTFAAEYSHHVYKISL